MKPQDVERTLAEFLTSLGVADAPGLSVAIAYGEEQPICGQTGRLGPSDSRPITEDTPFRIGSTTKQFTAAAALLLAQKGRLDPDASICDGLGETSQVLGEVRLRDCLTCTSGIRDELDIWLFSRGPSFMSGAEGVRRALARRSINFRPGTRFCYNNTGFALASLVIERTGPGSFETVLREKLLEPAGLADTALFANDAHLPDRCARTSLPDGDGHALASFPTEITGEGGLIATPKDLVRWNRWLRAVEDGAIFERMTAPTSLDRGGASAYGFALIREFSRGVERIHHPGGVIGGSAQLVFYPKAGCTIAVASNNGTLSAPDIADRLAERLCILPPAPPPAHTGPVGDFIEPTSGRGFSLRAGALDLHVHTLPLVERSDGSVAAESAGLGQIAFGKRGGKTFLQEHGQVRLLDKISCGPVDADASGAFVRGDVRIDIEAKEMRISAPEGETYYALTSIGADSWAAVPRSAIPLYATVQRTERGVSVSTLRNWNLAFEPIGTGT
ncbi:serine hydrolase domain-containing protein [Aurantiacibacter gangjinensis]|uniref:Uncharacterized protein n=1 Tax=Aurantiacibacter gangjinensis TaxID=502682 RepID=A0A0G9ML82_9SPHN|nr:serine hydrolase domain-containing protein [Aurantiacibacter gangjinensis]APE27412.1 Beta-lactamase [Aurantiacibacter gangjinensis]KLE31486.1 hypothetical protein AAW01_07885 [Aurantiacibacter gangjinensis]